MISEANDPLDGHGRRAAPALDLVAAMRTDPGSESAMGVELPPWSRGMGAPHRPEPEEGDNALVALLALLRRNAALIAGCAVAVGALAYLLSAQMSERYASTASLLFRQSPLVGQLTGIADGERFNTVEQEGATNVALVSSRPVATETARRLGGGYDLESVQDAMLITARPETRVVDLTAEAGSGPEAVRVADTYAQVFLEQRTRQVKSQIEDALDRLERERDLLPPDVRDGPVGDDLTERMGTLVTLNAVQSPNVELIQPAAVPNEPVAPRPRRNAILGVMFGFLLGLGLAALRQQTDRRIRDVADLESFSQSPLLGVVPRHPALARPTRPVDLPHEVVDAFRLVQASVLRRFGVGTHAPLLIFTSAAQGEGKTVCAWHFAVATAATGGRTLLIEADLRRPSIADRWGLAPHPGLSDVLLGRAAASDVIQEVPVTDGAGDDQRDSATLHVMTAGEAVSRSADLFYSTAMPELIQESVADYDAVVVDTPPIGQAADAIPLVSAASGVVIVASPGTTNRRAFQRLQANLDQFGAPGTGVVANGVRTRGLPGSSRYVA